MHVLLHSPREKDARNQRQEVVNVVSYSWASEPNRSRGGIFFCFMTHKLQEEANAEDRSAGCMGRDIDDDGNVRR